MMKKNLCFLLLLVLVTLSPHLLRAQVAFVNGAGPQTATACQSGGAFDLSSFLGFTDATTGSTDQITNILSLPGFGTLSGFPFDTTSNGGTITPEGLFYTPTTLLTGLPGTDLMTFQISNGADSTTTTINVTVNPAPTVAADINTFADSGATTANISYTVTNTPDQYSIQWTTAALDSGFSNISNAALLSNPLVVTLPASLAPGVYNGTLYVNNSMTGCSSTGFSFSITIIGKPSVNNLPATAVTSSGAVLGASVQDNNGTTNVSFDYGTDTTGSLTNTGTVDSVIGGTGTDTIYTTLTGLLPNTTYYFRADGVNSDGTTQAEPFLSFTTGDNPPIFVNGVSQSLVPLCQGAAGTNLGTYLAITSADTGIKTFSPVFGDTPLHGTLTGFDTSIDYTGGTQSPAGLYYTPDSSYVGTDSFTIQVTDGIDTAYTTIHVIIDSLPSIVLGANPAVTEGTTTASLSYTTTGGSPVNYSTSWSPAATTAGFVDSTNAALTGSPIVLAIPATAHAGVYSGDITVANTNDCSSSSYPFTVTISGAPTVVTDPATSVTTRSATLNATINDSESNSAVSFHISTSPTFTTYLSYNAAIDSVSAGSGSIADSFTVTGLSPNTTYYFRAYAANSLGMDSGSVRNFTTQYTPSFDSAANAAYINVCQFVKTSVDSALAVVDTTAGQTLIYTLSQPAGFGHGAATGFPDTVTSTGGITYPSGLYYQPAGGYNGDDTFVVAVKDLYGDSSNITVYVHIVTSPTINVAPEPGAAFGAATANLYYTATNSPTTYSINYDSTAMADGFSNVSNATLPPSPITLVIPLLEPVGVYSGSVTVTNSIGCVSHNSEPFLLTIGNLPIVLTEAASSVGSTFATLNGSVNDNGDTTTTGFKYSTSSTLAGATLYVATPSTVSSGTATADSLQVSGLAPNTTYYFRAFGTNAAGSDSGLILSFKTQDAPVFTTGNDASQSITICENSGSYNLDTVLETTDSTALQVITWSVFDSSVHGTLVGNAVAISTVGANYPSGLSYTPDAGYSGTDSFKIEIKDNFGDSSFKTVHVTIDALPTFVAGTDPSVAHGATAASLTYTVTGAPTHYSITYGSAAHTAGFTDTSATLTGSPLTLAVPAGAAVGSYSATLTVSNANGCTSATPVDFSINVYNPAAGVISESATNITAYSVTLNASVNDSGSTTYVYFEYDTSSTLAVHHTSGPDTVVGAGTATDSVNVNGLSYHTKYYYRAFAINASGDTTFGSIDNFTTLYPVTFAGGSSVVSTSVCENSTANNIDSLLGASDSTAGQKLTWTLLSISNGSATVSTSDSPSVAGDNYPSGFTFTPASGYTGLDTIIVRINDGIGDTLDKTILATVNSMPTIALGADSSVTQGTTAMNLYYTDTTGATHYSITYDATGHAAGFTDVTDTLAGSPISVAIPATAAVGTYTAALTVSNASGCTSANASDFVITITGPASIITDSATNVYTTSATLNATVNDSGSTTTVYFLYSTFPSLASADTAHAISVSDTGNVTDSANITGLTENTTYYFRAYGSNASGLDSGAIDSFTTEYRSGFVSNSVPLSACQNSDSVSIDSLLGVADSTAGQILTWSVYFPATNGSVNVNYSDTSISGVNYPTGTTYIPDSGYVGTDSFIVSEVSNTGDSSHVTVYVTVNPTPSVTQPGHYAFCNNTATSTTIIFSGSSIPGTIYRDTVLDNIGAAHYGVDSLVPFTPRPSADSSLVVVTPYANGCAGKEDSFTIVLIQAPTVIHTSDMSYCNGSATATTVFSGTGTSYNWANLYNTSIGLPDSSGVDSIASFTATASGSSVTQATIIVTPMDSVTGCSGTVDTFRIAVTPTPGVTITPDTQYVCNGTPTQVINFNFTVPGTTYTWTNSNSSIGLADTGSGSSIDTFTAHNASGADLFDTITVTPSVGTCVGTSQTAIIIVTPPPSISNAITPDPLCDNTALAYTPLSNATPGASYTWSRGTTPGISNPAVTSTDTTGAITETLHNISGAAVNVTYVYTVSAYGCVDTQSESVTVEPNVVFTNTVTADSICSGTEFSYTFTSNISGVTFTYSRDSVDGISNGAANDTGNINEILVNTTNSPVTVTYLDTVTINGSACYATQSNTVYVKPMPKLTSSLDDTSICSGQTFVYVPTSNVPSGYTFYWDRPFVAGISSAGADGTGSIDEQLVNLTNFDIRVAYYYIDSANGCGTDTAQQLSVTVHPTPALTSPLTDTVCSGQAFVYAPTSTIGAATYTWTRAVVSGISNGAGSGTDSISETLTNTAGTATNVIYDYTITADSFACSSTDSITVTVDPSPAAPSITTESPASLCSGTMYQNFGAAVPLLTGQTYVWGAQNAEVYATGSTDQYVLINFDHTGTAIVTLSFSQDAASCASQATYTVTVGSDVSGTPEVIYAESNLVCLDNTVDSYQWGYDDISTLDSTILPGETNQFYPAPVLDPTKLYWVITVKNGCMQKTYYQVPAAGQHRTANGGGGAVTATTQATSVKIYPNPASEEINVAITTSIAGDIQVDVLNLLGQKLYSTQAINDKAKINVAGLPAGTYLINCYREGVQISAARFIKN